MKKTIALLSILLFGQIALSLYIYAPRGQKAAGNPSLIAFEKDQVDQIQIEDNQQGKVTLRRQGAHWLIPDADDFPADNDAVNTLLSRLEGAKAGWPVATTAEAAEHFKVADKHFVRRLTLTHGSETLARLYLGSSPGFRKIYARADGHTDIHSILFNAFDANARVDDWIDKHPLKVAEPDISGVSLPTLTLVRQGKGLALADLQAGEEMNGDETAALTEYLADIPIIGLPGQDTKGQPDDSLEFSLNIKGEGKRNYRFQKLEHGVDYLLTVSGRKRHFLVSATTVEHLKSFNRDKLVSSKTGDHTQQPSNHTTGQ